jgi:hypothetical protein
MAEHRRCMIAAMPIFEPKDRNRTLGARVEWRIRAGSRLSFVDADAA